MIRGQPGSGCQNAVRRPELKRCGLPDSSSVSSARPLPDLALRALSNLTHFQVSRPATPTSVPGYSGIKQSPRTRNWGRDARRAHRTLPAWLNTLASRGGTRDLSPPANVEKRGQLPFSPVHARFFSRPLHSGSLFNPWSLHNLSLDSRQLVGFGHERKPRTKVERSFITCATNRSRVLAVERGVSVTALTRRSGSRT